MKYTIRPFKYGPYDYRDAEILLNKMSQRGWDFKTTSKGWIRNWAMFEKIKEENKTTYNIDLKGAMNDREKDEYCRFYADLGWQHLDTYNTYNKKLHIFKSSRKDTIPIYSEDQAEYENLKEYGNVSTDMFHLLTFLLITFSMYIFYRSSGIAISLIIYSIMITLTMFLVDAAVMIFLNVNYRKICKKSMEKTGQLPQNVLLKKWRIWEIYGENLIILFMGFGTIVGLGYEIWGKGFTPQNEMIFWKFIYFGLAFVGFWGMLLTDYMYMMKLEKQYLSIIDKVFVSFWIFALISYLQLFN